MVGTLATGSNNTARMKGTFEKSGSFIAWIASRHRRRKIIVPKATEKMRVL